MSVLKILGGTKRGMLFAAAVAMLGICGAGHVNARQNPLELGIFPEFTGGSSLPQCQSRHLSCLFETADRSAKLVDADRSYVSETD